ncbi:GNAT family N-acetyltransferase [Vibrio quintilis]|uniref:Putative ribosomal N-acetyltransferase YdaF n=1 Tax=Vibrio quintilis TaxID=1117707 RepID=A0A1M7YPJ5_9VIBR|nr:GNAT family N-acetyltransferase [Vibrio quintilis]SHO54519.1 Putative ribosomal N-acetyltransferase YdaF [Vibrio quintilis]
MAIRIELISTEDVDELLEFELTNRSWFDLHISPRNEDFYSPQGVKSQISEFLSLHTHGKMYPMLIRTGSNEICGRINVHRIESGNGTGELGYRIGERFASKGIASKAVNRLISYLVSESKLGVLKAIVLTSNLGSRKVLERNGFRKVKDIPKYAELNGDLKDAIEYERTLLR